MSHGFDSGSFGRVAELHLRRLARFALGLERGGVSRGAIAQQSAALRRFHLSAQEVGQDRVAERIAELTQELAEPPDRTGPRSSVVQSILGALVEDCRVSPSPPIASRERLSGRRDDDRHERARAGTAVPLEDLDRLAAELDAPQARRLREIVRTLRSRLESISLTSLAPVVGRVFEMGERAARDRSIVWARRGDGLSVEPRVASWLEGHLGQLVLNARQHGRGVHSIWIDLALVAGGLEVEVGDDGDDDDGDDGGFARRAFSVEGGLSHLSREVAERGGEIVLSRSPDEGTRVRFRIPIDRARLSCLHLQAGGSLAVPADRVLSLPGEKTGEALDLSALLWGKSSRAEGPKTIVVLDASGEAIPIEVDGVGPRLSTVVHPLALPGSSLVAAGLHGPDGGVGYLLDVEALGSPLSGRRSRRAPPRTDRRSG